MLIDKVYPPLRVSIELNINYIFLFNFVLDVISFSWKNSGLELMLAMILVLQIEPQIK